MSAVPVHVASADPVAVFRVIALAVVNHILITQSATEPVSQGNIEIGLPFGFVIPIPSSVKGCNQI